MRRPALVVLVIDDEVRIRRFLRAGFELEAFIVQEAATGAEGIRAATLKPVDLVIIDLELPDMDGAEIVERLRSWSKVPIIVLSVRASEEEKVRLLEIWARRLRGQAVRHGRAVGAGARSLAAAGARTAGRSSRQSRLPHRRPCCSYGQRRRQADQFVAQRVQAAAGACPACGKRRHPPPPPEGSSGNAHSDDAHYLEDLCSQAPSENREGPHATPHSDH